MSNYKTTAAEFLNVGFNNSYAIRIRKHVLIERLANIKNVWSTATNSGKTKSVHQIDVKTVRELINVDGSLSRSIYS